MNRFHCRLPSFVYSQSMRSGVRSGVRLGRRADHALDYQNVAPGKTIRSISGCHIYVVIGVREMRENHRYEYLPVAP